MTTTTFARAEDSDKSTKLFDKKDGKNYIDCILDFIDNARTSSVTVDDIDELEARFKHIQEETAELEKGL